MSLEKIETLLEKILSQEKIEKLLEKIQDKKITDKEQIELTVMLNSKLKSATDTTNGRSYTNELDPLSSVRHYGNQCVYEEFAKISKLSHELSMAGMNKELKTFYIYLLDKHVSHTLNMSQACYGMFGPALYKSEEDVINLHKQIIKVQGFEYVVGHGITHKQFTLQETLAYRHSIHVFFDDLLKLCITEDTILDDIALPLLKKLIRSEAEINLDFINTLMESISPEAEETAMKLAKKFVPTSEQQKAAAAAETPGDEDEELAAALPKEPAYSTKGIRPEAVLKACSVESPDDRVLDLISGGNFENALREYREPATGNTLLHLAAMKGTAAAVTKMITAGGDVDATNNAGLKPAELVPEGNVEVMRAFDDAGDGRMSPISGELMEWMGEIDGSELGDTPNFLRAFERAKTAHDFAELKYLNRAAESELNTAFDSRNMGAVQEVFANLLAELNAWIPAPPEAHDDSYMELGSLFD